MQSMKSLEVSMWEVKSRVSEIMGFGREPVALAESTLWLGCISYIPAKGLRKESERSCFFCLLLMEYIKKVLQLLMVLGVKWVLSEGQTTGALRWNRLDAAQPKKKQRDSRGRERERAGSQSDRNTHSEGKPGTQSLSITVKGFSLTLCFRLINTRLFHLFLFRTKPVKNHYLASD